MAQNEILCTRFPAPAKKMPKDVQNQDKLIAVFHSSNMIYKVFVPQGQIVNVELYDIVLKCLFLRILHVRPQYVRS